MHTIQESGGWKIKAGGTHFNFDKRVALVWLATASGFNRCASIVSTTNSQDYLKDIETLLASVDLKKPETITTEITPLNNDQYSIVGTWKSSASNNSDYSMKHGVMSSISRQYTFNADGSYNFVSETFDPMMSNLLLGRENGSYQINANNITISPAKSVLQAWTKKQGTGSWGELINTQNVNTEKITYTFTKYYFTGIQVWNLILQAGEATKRDGPYGSNDTFKNAWFYKPLSANNPAIELPD